MIELQHIASPVSQLMDECRQRFDSFMSHSNPLLNEVLQRVTQRKGKMMRPLLTLLCAKIADENEVFSDNSTFFQLSSTDNQAVLSALTFEFLHTASLIHDDVVDESNERRGLSSVNTAYSNKIAVLVGDFILANSLKTAAMTDNPQLVDIVSETAQYLADGELLQLRNALNSSISEDVYFHIIEAKTAALFSACAKAGALAIGASADIQERLRQFGEYVGICFQIKDDIFDYIAGTEIGKPTGNDMREGKLTLPCIHVLLSQNNEEAWQLAYKVKDGTVSHDEIDQLIDFTVQNHGIDHAISVMADYASRAKQILSVFSASPYRDALNLYVDYVVERNF